MPNPHGSKILSYHVTRDVGTGVFFEVYNGSDLNFTDTRLQAGQTYKYKVTAENYIGMGSESEIITAIAGSIPQKITTQKIELQSQTILTISWEALTLKQSGDLSVINYLVKSDNADF